MVAVEESDAFDSLRLRLAKRLTPISDPVKSSTTARARRVIGRDSPVIVAVLTEAQRCFTPNGASATTVLLWAFHCRQQEVLWPVVKQSW